MEHWFDSLSRPHTRRTTLKAAAVAGAALVLPGVRVPRAWATPSEPCFKPCNDAAKKRWSTQDNICRQSVNTEAVGLFAGAAFAGPYILIEILSIVDFGRCRSSAELDWHRDSLACRGSECGNSGKYPDGNAPKPPAPHCDPAQEIPCGDKCCNNLNVCCQCKNGGTYICCTDAEHCEPDPQGNRGSCCG